MTILRRILAMEPVAVQGVVRTLFIFLGIAGLSIPEDVSGQILAGVAAAYALVDAATTLWARSKVRPTAKDAE